MVIEKFTYTHIYGSNGVLAILITEILVQNKWLCVKICTSNFNSFHHQLAKHYDAKLTLLKLTFLHSPSLMTVYIQTNYTILKLNAPKTFTGNSVSVVYTSFLVNFVIFQKTYKRISCNNYNNFNVQIDNQEKKLCFYFVCLIFK